MKISCWAALLALTMQITPASANEAALSAQVTKADGWVAYRVPIVADIGEPCCFLDASDQRSGCDLDERNWRVGMNSKVAAAPGNELAVHLRVKSGRIEQVRAFAATCPIRNASAIRWIDAVDPAHSVALLGAHVDRQDDRRNDDALAALAMHAHDAALRALGDRAEPGRERSTREQALFWLGQTRGVAGAEIVTRHARGDADPKLREHAVFVLSQTTAVDGYARIHAIAREDDAEQVRGQALFWMAQMNDALAAQDILDALRDDRSEHVREQAVFALSQLGDGKGDAALIALVRGDHPRAVKQRALFWLGQSGSPQALELFDDALR